jgi:hypothetical protein
VDGCDVAVDAAPCPKRLVVGAAAGVAVGVPKSVFCADGCGAFEESGPNGLAAFEAAGAPKDSAGVDAGASVVLSCAKRPPPEVEPPVAAPNMGFGWVPPVVGGVADGVVEAVFVNRDFCAAGVDVPNGVEPAGFSCGFLFSVPEAAPNIGLAVPLVAPKSPDAFPVEPKRLLGAADVAADADVA